MGQKLTSRIKKAAIAVLASSFMDSQSSFAADAFRIPEGSQMVEELKDNPSFLKSQGYIVFGGKYYSPDLGHPIAQEKLSYSELQGIDVPLKSDLYRNRGSDKTGWVPIPAGKGRTYFRAEHHMRELDVDLERILDGITPHYEGKGMDKTYSPDEMRLMQLRSKVHAVAFPSKDFGLRYHPGSTLLVNENGFENGKRLERPRAEVKQPYQRIAAEDLARLVGVFNGTFYNSDAIKVVDGKRRLPGLIVDEKTIDEPVKDLATIAFYKDGSFKIGTLDSMPKEGIVFLRQNEFPLLHGGKIVESGAYPRRWTRFGDDILRSYFATTKDGRHFAYVWTIYCPPAVTAETLKTWGFSEAMLLDIHPVIAAILASPRTRDQENAVFSKKNSYNFVPDERAVVDFMTRKLATAINGRTIQWDYYVTLRNYMPHDFFSVIRKD